MENSVYKIIELVGTSTESWEKAALAALKRASDTLEDIRSAEVAAMDIQLAHGEILVYRTKLKVSFKYQDIE